MHYLYLPLFLENVSYIFQINTFIAFRQLSRTFKFDVPVIYLCRRIGLGIISYEIHLCTCNWKIVFVHKIEIQAVNSPFIHAKSHSNSVVSHF